MTLDIFVDRRLYRAEGTMLALNSALGSNRGFLQGSLSSTPVPTPIPFRYCSPNMYSLLYLSETFATPVPFDYIIFRRKKKNKETPSCSLR
jgi:hypothetical protein